eukprot:Gb_01934 [translate_table: standard]
MMLDLPTVGLSYDIAKGKFWWKEWGPRPLTSREALDIALHEFSKLDESSAYQNHRPADCCCTRWGRYKNSVSFLHYWVLWEDFLALNIGSIRVPFAAGGHHPIGNHKRWVVYFLWGGLAFLVPPHAPSPLSHCYLQDVMMHIANFCMATLMLNLLLSTNDRNAVLKIADFGFAR